MSNWNKTIINNLKEDMENNLSDDTKELIKKASLDYNLELQREDEIEALQEQLECKRAEYIERKNTIGKVDLNDKKIMKIAIEIDMIQCKIHELKNNKDK